MLKKEENVYFKLKIFIYNYKILKFNISRLKQECSNFKALKKEEIEKAVKEKTSLISVKELNILNKNFNLYDSELK